MRPYTIDINGIELETDIRKASSLRDYETIFERLLVTPKSTIVNASPRIPLVFLVNWLFGLSRNIEETFEKIVDLIINAMPEYLLKNMCTAQILWDLLKNNKYELLHLVLLKLPSGTVVEFLKQPPKWPSDPVKLFAGILAIASKDPHPLYAACMQIRLEQPGELDSAWTNFILREDSVRQDIQQNCDIILHIPYFSPPELSFAGAIHLKINKDYQRRLDYYKAKVLPFFIEDPRQFFELLYLDRTSVDFYLSLFTDAQLQSIIFRAYAQHCDPFFSWIDRREMRREADHRLLDIIINHDAFKNEILIDAVILQLFREENFALLNKIYLKLSPERQKNIIITNFNVDLFKELYRLENGRTTMQLFVNTLVALTPPDLMQVLGQLDGDLLGNGVLTKDCAIQICNHASELLKNHPKFCSSFAKIQEHMLENESLPLADMPPPYAAIPATLADTTLISTIAHLKSELEAAHKRVAALERQLGISGPSTVNHVSSSAKFRLSTGASVSSQAATSETHATSRNNDI